MDQSRDRFVVVVHVLLEVGGEVLLLRRAGTGRADGFWAPPGGHLERGELPRSGAARECAEEVGVLLPADALCPVATLAYRDGEDTGFNLVFAAAMPEPGVIRPDARVASEVALASTVALPEPCVPWLPDALARRRALLMLREDALPGAGSEVPWFGEPAD